MTRQGVVVIIPADGTKGGGEAAQAGHVKRVVAGGDEDGVGVRREGGREGGRNRRWKGGMGGREKAAEGFEADDALRAAVFSSGR